MQSYSKNLLIVEKQEQQLLSTLTGLKFEFVNNDPDDVDAITECRAVNSLGESMIVFTDTTLVKTIKDK